MSSPRRILPLGLFLFLALRALAAPPALRGALEPGPHAVGFTTLLREDLSRPAIGDPDRPDVPRRTGRAMQICVWYPARKGGRAMTLGDYADRLGQEIDFRPLGPELRGVGRRKLAADLVDWGADPKRAAADLEKLLGLPTDARAEAPRAAGRFPLVLYPAYRAPASMSILAEHLASWGFVVASTTTKGTSETELDVAVSGIESLTLDLAFVLGTMRADPRVDASRVGIVASGISATAALALEMREPAVAALVSLDGGITTESEQRMLRAMPHHDVSAAAAPLLAIWAPHPDVDPRRLDVYRYADRTVLHFPAMSEAYFQNRGALEDLAPGLLGKRVEGTRLGMEWASRYARRFLAAHLRADADARAFLERTPEENGAPPGLLTRTRVPGLPRPPSLLESKRIVRAEGIEALLDRLDELAARDAHPFPEQRYVDLYGWLSWHRDDDFSRRRALAAHFAKAYPASSRAHVRVGRVAQQTGDADAARRAYDRALASLPEDPDPVLDGAQRDALKEQIARFRRALDEKT